jgi:hypothetical protein
VKQQLTACLHAARWHLCQKSCRETLCNQAKWSGLRNSADRIRWLDLAIKATARTPVETRPIRSRAAIMWRRESRGRTIFKGRAH